MISLTMMELQRNMPRAKTKSSDSLKKKKKKNGEEEKAVMVGEMSLLCFVLPGKC